jgi:ATP-dependent DNA ligase
MAEFPVLQGDATTGKTKVWSIRVWDRDACGVIQTTHGYVDGKMTVNEKVIAEGKNQGKKNSTTPLQQAIAEAQALWIKKKESGYHHDQVHDGNGDNEEEKHSTKGKGICEEAPNVMLAHDYNKRGKDIDFPCFTQVKLDGTRAVAIPGKGIYSRNRKAYPHLEHIRAEIDRLHPSIVLDGELYSKTLTFQEIVGLVKRETIKEVDQAKHGEIKFYVYDMVNDHMPFMDRYANLQHIFRRHRFKHIVLVNTDVCRDVEQMKELHSIYVADGYEGLMLRNKKGLYKGSRSTDLQKYKEFVDGEYEIIGYEEGVGLEAGCVIWVCQVGDKTFHCRPRGTREERQELYRSGRSHLGKKLTVRYQELTDTGIPRFPVGISIRDYE